MGLRSFWNSLWKNDTVVTEPTCEVDCKCEPDTCEKEVPTVEVVETKKEEEIIGERLAEKVTAKEIKAKRKPVKKEVEAPAVEKKATKPRRRRKPKTKPDTDSDKQA